MLNVLSLSTALLVKSVLSSEKTCYIPTHVEKGCVLVIQTWAFIRNAVVDWVVAENLA